MEHMSLVLNTTLGTDEIMLSFILFFYFTYCYDLVWQHSIIELRISEYAA